MRNVETKNTTMAEDMVDAAGERAKSCVDAGVNAINAVSDRAHEIGSNADNYVRKNPWLMIGAAAGIGALIGLLIRGRR